MSSEKCMRHKGVLHKKGYPLHDEFMKDGRLFILGDSWGRKRWDGGPQTKKPTKTTKNNLPSNSDFIHQGEDFYFKFHQFSSVQFSSVAQSCLTLCNPVNSSTPGLPVHHQLPEFTQTHVHRVSDAIQPSHPWSSPSPPAPNPSQHQSLFQ